MTHTCRHCQQQFATYGQLMEHHQRSYWWTSWAWLCRGLEDPAMTNCGKLKLYAKRRGMYIALLVMFLTFVFFGTYIGFYIPKSVHHDVYDAGTCTNAPDKTCMDDVDCPGWFSGMTDGTLCAKPHMPLNQLIPTWWLVVGSLISVAACALTYVALQRIRQGRQAVLQLIAEGGGGDPAAIGSAAACGLSPPVAVAVAVAVPADVPVAYCV